MLRAIIRFVPPKPGTGDVVEVRCRAQHVMETGYRRDEGGRAIPRDILNRLVVAYGGETVFEARMFPAMSANPYIGFHIMAETSGPVRFTWTDDAGKVETVTAELTVG